MLPLLLLVVFLSVSVNAYQQAPHVHLFARHDVPQGWKLGAAALDESPVSFHLALTQRNLDVLDRVFTQVSDPRHEEYTNYLTNEEITRIVAPSEENRQVVFDWLHAHGATRYNDFIDSVEVFTSVAVASKLMQTNFYEFTHETTGKTIIKAMGSVSVPQDVHDVIDMVLGVSSFPVPHYTTHRMVPDAAPIVENDAIIPQTIWSLYSMPTNIKPGTSSISQGVIEWEGQSFDPVDLANFSIAVNVSLPTVDPIHIIGPNVPRRPGDEASLDIQFIAGVNPSGENWFWIEGSSAWLYGFAVHFLNTTRVPDIISVSYGWWEGDQCELGIGGEECQKLNITTTGYVQRVNTEFQKIGVRGVSILVSSGDSGAHTRSDTGCRQNRTLADFPGSSPYITSVGATQVESETSFDPSIAPVCDHKIHNYTCVKTGREVAVNVSRSFFTSGGGFSNVSRRLAYQEDVVQGYLKLADSLPPSEYFNHTGRAYPDVSAVGHNGFIFNGGQAILIGGTSESSPTFAGVVSKLAAAFKSKTRRSLGFLNPLLYQAYAVDPSLFIDVTQGDNICTEGGCAKTCTGYKTAPGYDAVTGLGSPNYANMLEYINDLADKVVARQAKKEKEAGAHGMYASTF